MTPRNSPQNLPSCFPLNLRFALPLLLSQPPCPQSLSSSIHSVLCSQIYLQKDECSDCVIFLMSKLLVLLNKVYTSQPSIQWLLQSSPTNLYSLITVFSNYTSSGFCQINPLSSNLSWTFYLGSCHSYHKECLPLPSSCHCSLPFASLHLFM